MSGHSSLVDLMIHITTVARDPDYDPTFNQLLEIAEDVTFTVLPVETEFELLIKEWLEHREGMKWAFWAPPGVAHAYMKYNLDLLSLKPPHACLFQNEETAMRWLVDGEESPDRSPLHI